MWQPGGPRGGKPCQTIVGHRSPRASIKIGPHLRAASIVLGREKGIRPAFPATLRKRSAAENTAKYPAAGTGTTAVRAALNLARVAMFAGAAMAAPPRESQAVRKCGSFPLVPRMLAPCPPLKQNRIWPLHRLVRRAAALGVPLRSMSSFPIDRMPDEHLSEITLRDRLAGSLPLEHRERFDRHLRNCTLCQRKAEAWSQGQQAEAASSGSGNLPAQELARYERLDAICDQFEARWQCGEEPDIEDFAASVPPEEQPALRCELLLLSCQLAERSQQPSVGPAPRPASPVDRTPRRPASRRHRKPATLGPYRLVDEISRTAATAVHRAVHLETGEVVAIKRLRSRIRLSEADLVRLEAPAQEAAKLRHRHLIAMHGMHTDGLHHYWVMELVEGEPLSERLRAGPMPQKTAASLIRQLAEALEHAHRAGLVHAHVRPEKILIDRRGEPHLLGFGLPRHLPGSSELSTTRSLEPPGHLAPEQARHSGAATFASDIYALGALFYRMLAGVSPLATQSLPEFFRQLVSEPPVPPREHRGAIDRQLEAICLRCLEKDPAARFPSAQALADALAWRLWQLGWWRVRAWRPAWRAWRRRQMR